MSNVAKTGKNSPIAIGDITVKPGQSVNVDLAVADLYTGTPLSMPVRVICGRKAGPVLFVSAAVHGDELNGVEIVRRLLRKRSLGSIRGTLLAVPVVNVHGFLNQSRYLPDRRDLNRSFPGGAKGSIAARLAKIFIDEVVSKADFGIDLHTGAINRSNLPQIRANMDNPQVLEMAMAFGSPVIINSQILDGSLRAHAEKLDIPLMVYEAGEALRFDEMCISAGLRGVENVMRLIGMLPESKKKKPLNPVLARSSSWVRAPESGIVSMKVALGKRVSEGQKIAIVSDPIGDTITPVIAPFDGVVIGCSNLPLAHEGDALFHIAAFRDMGRAEDRLEEFVAEHDPEAS